MFLVFYVTLAKYDTMKIIIKTLIINAFGYTGFSYNDVTCSNNNMPLHMCFIFTVISKII